jgi:hypothetical protein
MPSARIAPQQPDPATYVGDEQELRRRATIEDERDFRLALFRKRETYERALERAAEVMAELRVARPTATVMYRILWADAAGAIQSTATVVFFSARAFAADVRIREGSSGDYGPLNETHRRPRILSTQIFCVASAASVRLVSAVRPRDKTPPRPARLTIR